jgi:tRNA-2-methylthio-N6-dimethylallyladenosine synthase
MKKLFVKTYGCQMNAYDSAKMADLLAPLGYAATDAPDGADMVILNTCHIREKAAEKVYSELGRLRTLKAEKAQSGGRMLLAVAGCVAQAEGEEIVARQPAVDLVVGPQSYHRLPEMIARAAREQGHALQTDFPALEKFDSLPEPSASGVSAFLTVQEGCDKFCTFCVVPYTRGSEQSRPPQAILREARQLADKGAREIVLLGQNVNAYNGPSSDNKHWSLARLCDALAEIENIERIRYTTSHPRDMGDDLIAAHGANPKLMPYLHLPVQSGSDAVLEAMNRQHSHDDYRRLVERIRGARPDIALTSDFIVGFPGESDADFQATLQLVGDIGYATAFSFKYSKRPGTPASTMRKQIPEDVKAARLDALQKLLLKQQYAFDDSQMGKVLPVLFEKRARDEGQIMGRTPYLQPVHVHADAAMIGRVVDVRIERRTANSLHGVLA